MRTLACLALLSSALALAQHAIAEVPIAAAAPATDATAEPAAEPAALAVDEAKPAGVTAEAGKPASIDPPTEADSPAAADKTADAAAPPEQVEPTAYERAVSSLASGSSMRLESKASASDGQVQKATGTAQGKVYAIKVSSEPQGDSSNDGNWLVQNGRFMKRSASGMAPSDMPPASIALLLESIALLPGSESGLESTKSTASEAAGVACQVRTVKLSAPSERISELTACVDEANASIVRLDARTIAGEQFSAVLTPLETTVSRPESNGRDWANEYPVAEPENRRQKLKYEDCPELIHLLPKGCKDFIPLPPEDTEAPTKKSRD